MVYKMTMIAIMFMMFVSLVFMIEAADVKKEKDKPFKK
tara:strand:+ start:483 stop:596 length:114 start_codon:yes stop_codon:yes gene_type:complete